MGRPQRKRRTIDLKTCADEYITVHELATYWRVSVSAIRRDIRKGALRTVRVGSAKAIRIPIAAAREYGRPSAA